MANGGSSSLVPCMCWVPKGVSKETPDKVELSEEELQELMRETREQMRDLTVSDKKEVENDSKGMMEGVNNGEEVSVEKEYNLAEYSSSESDEEGVKVSGAGMGNSLAGLAYYASNGSDPYITLKNPSHEDNEEEDFKILSSDNLLIIGRADDEFSNVEIHVFSEDDFHNYSHHEILLTSFPLAMEWMDFDPGEPNKKGSYLVVGMMTPGIEIWDLDLVDGLEPVLTLGNTTFDLTLKSSRKSSKSRKKNKKTSGKSVDSDVNSHSDAVLGLSWNRIVRTALASASADKTVRIWDMCGPKCVLTLPHPDKVQCVQWHPYEPQILASGAYDGKIRLFDCMASKTKIRVWKLDGEIERLLWNQLKPDQLLVSTDSHTVHCLDRTSDATLYQIHAHTDAISDLSLSCYMPGLLVTASTDDTIKFWDVQDDKPVFLLSKTMHMGAVLCARFCVDSPYALAVGGMKNGFQIIDVRQLEPVAQSIRGRDLMIPLMQDREEKEKEGVTDVDQDEGLNGAGSLLKSVDGIKSDSTTEREGEGEGEGEGLESMETEETSSETECRVRKKQGTRQGKKRYKGKSRRH